MSFKDVDPLTALNMNNTNGSKLLTKIQKQRDMNLHPVSKLIMVVDQNRRLPVSETVTETTDSPVAIFPKLPTHLTKPLEITILTFLL